MAMIFSLPGRQSGFEELARSAAARRGAPLSEAAMMQLAQGMGAEDPFPIGMQFSNDQPVAKPLTKEQQARANMAAVMAQLAGRKEQGIAKYEQGVADKQLGRDRIPRSAEGMTGIDEVANAAYRQRAAQARDDNARSMAPLAQVLAQVSQQSGPQGNLWRRDPRAAVALQTAQMAAQDRGLDRESQAAAAMSALAESQADRASRERMQGNTISAQERIAGANADRDLTREKNQADLQVRLHELQQAQALAMNNGNLDQARALQKQTADLNLAIAKMQSDTQEKIAGMGKSDPAFIAYTAKVDSIKHDDNLTPEEKTQQIDALSMPGAAQSPSTSATLSSPKLAIEQTPARLRKAWDVVAPGGTMMSFLKALPEQDIDTNLPAIKTYLSARYPNQNVNDKLWSTMGSASDRQRTDNLRKKFGLQPMNANLVLRMFGGTDSVGADYDNPVPFFDDWRPSLSKMFGQE